MEITEQCSCHRPRQQFSQACVLSGQFPKLWRATCSHWDNCFFCTSLLLLPSDDRVYLNSWLKPCWFLNGIVKCTGKQMKLDHVLFYACSLSKYGTPIERSQLPSFPLYSTPKRTVERPTSYGFLLVMLPLLMSARKRQNGHLIAFDLSFS